MEKNLRFMNVIRIALVASLVLYAAVAFTLAHPREISSTFFYAIAAVAVIILVTAFQLRERMVGGAEEVLRTSPDDAAAWVRWRKGHILFFCLCESVGLYGLVLRFTGATAAQAIPFFVVAIACMLLFGPQRP